MIVELILYGAGKKLPYIYSELKKSYNILCIVDKDVNKQGLDIEMPDGIKLKVLSLEDALNRFPGAKLWITPAVPLKYEIMKELMAVPFIDKDDIQNYEAVTYRRSCYMAENMLALSDGFLKVCCGCIDAPQINYSNNNISNEELVDVFLNFKNKLIRSFINEECSQQCLNCTFLEYNYFKDLSKITHIAFNVAPFCQFKCVYCKHLEEFNKKLSKKTINNILRNLDFINFLKKNNYIDNDVVLGISNGEITVNPLRKEIFNVIRDFQCMFVINGEFYSEEIEAALLTGNASVNISIDAGTADTFKIVKGRDCFDKVVKNIRKYSLAAEPAKITLKYIILPGINDNKTDAYGFINLVYDINGDVIVSRDMYNVKNFDDNIDSCLEIAKTIITEVRGKGLNVFNMMNNSSPPSKYKERIERMFT